MTKNHHGTFFYFISKFLERGKLFPLTSLYGIIFQYALQFLS
jgi:hypothetical protein